MEQKVDAMPLSADLKYAGDHLVTQSTESLPKWKSERNQPFDRHHAGFFLNKRNLI